MAVCRVCETRGPNDGGGFVQGACPDCQSMSQLIEAWFDERSITTDAGYSTVGYDDVEVLKTRVLRFFAIYKPPTAMKWG